VKCINRSLIFPAGSDSIITNNSSRRRWAENKACLGKLRNSYEIFVGNYGVRISLSRTNRDGLKFKSRGNEIVYCGLPHERESGNL